MLMPHDVIVFPHFLLHCKHDRASLFPVVPSGRNRGNGHQLKHRRFPLNISNNSLWGRLNTGTGCPKRLWSLCPWRYPKDAWTQSWATGSRWPCWSRELDQMTFRGSCQPQPFCDPVIPVPKLSQCLPFPNLIDVNHPFSPFNLSWY